MGAISFVAVFTYLAANFGYPDVLNGEAAEVLPELLSIGTPGRLVWAFYSARAMLDSNSGFPRWPGYWGLLTALTGLVGMFRNVTDAVLPIAGVNNFLLPLWMIAFGIGMLRVRAPLASSPLLAREPAALSGVV